MSCVSGEWDAVYNSIRRYAYGRFPNLNFVLAQRLGACAICYMPLKVGATDVARIPVAPGKPRAVACRGCCERIASFTQEGAL